MFLPSHCPSFAGPYKPSACVLNNGACIQTLNLQISVSLKATLESGKQYRIRLNLRRLSAQFPLVSQNVLYFF